MTSNSTAIEAFKAYAIFCHTIWAPAVGGRRSKDLVVMGYGLSGEWGEVAELLAEGLPQDDATRAHLCEELGDTVYYWARIAGAYRLSIDALVAGVLDESDFTPNTLVRFESVAKVALKMTACAGRVTEVLKKKVRDGHLDRSLLIQAMRETLLYWGAICAQCGLDWRDVLASNKTKVTGRAAKRAGAGQALPA